MFVARRLVFTILVLGIFGIGEVISHKRGKGRLLRPSGLAYQNQYLPVQQLHIPRNNYHSPSSVYSTPQKQLPVYPVAPRPGIVVFGVGPHSLQIPNHYSNFLETSFVSGKSNPSLSSYTRQNTAATNPALKAKPTISVTPKPVAYQQNIEPAKSSNPVQHAQLAKPPQYGNKIPTNNPHHKRPSYSAVPDVTVAKVPENVPVYISPVKSTVYASAYVSDSASYPEKNYLTKEETSSYHTTPPSILKSTVSSSYKETKAYQSTETYSKTTTKSEIKENQPHYSQLSPTSEVSESHTHKDDSYTKQKEYVNESKLKSAPYSETSYKKVESLPVIENEKKEDSTGHVNSAPKYKTVSDATSIRKPYDISKVEEGQSKIPNYPISQSYKITEEHKPVKESYEKNTFQESYVDESEAKDSFPSVSIDSSPYSENKKNDFPIPSYSSSEQKSSSRPYKKTLTKESDDSESKPLKNPVILAPGSYKEVESLLPYNEDPKKQNVPNYVPTSKPYQPQSPSVSAVTKSSHSTKDEKSYLQSKSTEPSVLSTKVTKPLEYSTGYTTTTKTSEYSPSEGIPSYYSTTSKYQEPITYSSLATSTHLTQRGYTSPTSYEKSSISTTRPTPLKDNNQYLVKSYTTKATSVSVPVETPYNSYTSTASPFDKSNDRVYVSSGQGEHENAYPKQGPSPNNQSYTSTGQYQSVGVRPSSANPLLNEYTSIEKSSTNYPTIGAEIKSNNKTRPTESPADYLSTSHSKPIEKSYSSKSFAAVTENYKTDDHDGSESEGDYSAIPGKPDIDYPIFSELPNDQFKCSEQRLPGYYADVSARCQVFHICLGDRQWSFLCPNGTIFSQEHFVCVWWYEFDCSKATSLYGLNEKLFVISSTEQANKGEYENKQYAKSTVSETSTKSDKDYQSSNTQEEPVVGPFYN